MKKLLSILLALCFATALAGCSNPNKENNDKPADNTVTLEQKETTEKVEMTEYTINNITYGVPANCTVKSDADDGKMVSFSIGSTENDMVLVWSNIIPDIMRVKLDMNGEISGYITKDDVAEQYGVKDDDTTDVTAKEWKNDYGFEYCDMYFSNTGKLASGEQDTRKGRCAVIPINENEQFYSVRVLSENENDLKIIDDILASVKLP